MAPSVVQANGNANFATSTSIAMSSNVTSGNILVAYGICGTAGTALNTPTSTGTSTVSWAVVQGPTTTGSFIQGWFLGTITGTGTCTPAISSTGSSAQINIGVWEVSGSTSSQDGTGAFSSTFHSGAFNGPSVTTTSSGDIVLAAAAPNNNTIMTIGGSWVSDFAASLDSTSFYLALAHIIQSSAGAITAPWTPSVGATVSAAEVAFPASGPANQPFEDDTFNPAVIGMLVQPWEPQISVW